MARPYWLAPRVLRLGASYFESGRVPRLVQPFLQRLATSTKGPAYAYASVRDGDEIVSYRTQQAAPWAQHGVRSRLAHTADINLGGLDAAVEFLRCRTRCVPGTLSDKGVHPHTITSVARLRLEVVRARTGDFVLEQQLQPGMRGVAVLLRDQGDKAVGALSLTIRFAAVFSDKDIRADMIRMFAKDIEADFTVEPFYGGSLFKQGTELVALQRDNLEMGNIAPRTSPSRSPRGRS